MRHVLAHLRANAIAYLALFVALGGTGYAATRLPAGSVGARQIKNHVIQPVKLDRRLIGGTVRMWASVSAAGKVLAGGAGMAVSQVSGVPGDYVANPRKGSKLAVPRKCSAVASVDQNPDEVPGYAEADVSTFPSGVPWQLFVSTYAPDGHRESLPFDVVVIC
jgi:hypothetical protein